MKILVLNENDIKNAFSMKDAIEASKDALEAYSANSTNIPLRTNIDIPKAEGQSLYMPGYVSDSNALGIKIVSVYPNNVDLGISSVPSTMLLLDEETGQVCSILDGTYLTQMRTGAVSGAATDLLARQDSKIFTLFGTGGQAECQVEAVLNVRDIKEVRVCARNQQKTEDFVERMNEKFADKFNVEFKVVMDSDSAVKDADIITVVTTSKEPVFDGRLVKKGTHINGVGSFTPDMQEVDEHLLNNSDKIYLDTKDGVINESGDFITPIKEGKFSESSITGELGQLILGKIPSRENSNEITFFKTVGSAVLDLVTAKRIYENALEDKTGNFIEM